MEQKLFHKLHSLIFILGGALAGLAYYYLAGCITGSCPITANPAVTMLYMGLIGWLLAGITAKGCDNGCSM